METTLFHGSKLLIIMVKLVKNDENNGELWMNNGQLVSLLVKKNQKLRAGSYGPLAHGYT
jgi:hypothetical protein